ncbi:rhodanese-like domain-containing protein [Janibacter sp. CX7]|uniref:rhodanese-like domain-containing protein n=1 Tax=Janibacter sp. CX7 TaxID=2963431 RepID=UPI0020CDE30B|nr:rhodanese-like domain-containing protein [Janibacter sp. CX7]UTT64929.1 rhodanese-like domain-containing protein [Janibacter sp. CX7]
MTQHADLTPRQAWERLESDPDAVLVDVRTSAEWSFVGLPDLTSVGKRVVPIEWTTFPDGAPNPRFLDDLRASIPTDDTPVLFLCRSGARSAAATAAATAAGYTAAHNVAEGFEGDLDAQGHRAVNGWKQAGLPWRQG